MDIDLNADLGEGYGAWQIGDDDALLGILSSANIACGFHAGDPLIMDRTVRIAGARGVDIGAHVSFPDRQGFGRRAMQIDAPELAAMITYQLGALAGIARSAGSLRPCAHRGLVRLPRHRGCRRAGSSARRHHLPRRSRL